MTEGTQERSERSPRRRRLAAGMIVVVGLIGIGVVAAMATNGSDDGDDGAEAPTQPVETVDVTRRDLEQTEDFDGTLAYRGSSELTVPGGGTVTGLPAVGTIVTAGDSLLEIDGRPVILLTGERPMWRELGPGVDDGADVFQLEHNLRELGVEGADQLSVDDEWTSYTTEVVENWQESLGVEETGRIERGDVAFRPQPVRIAERLAEVGDEAGGPLLRGSGTQQRVTVNVPTNKRQWFEVGAPVDIELPDGTTIAGTVERVGEAVTKSDDGSSTVPVTITVDDPDVIEGLDDVDVEVTVVSTAATDVLAVPVDALLAVAEGGFAVEVAGGATTELVAVETGMFADGWVEVTGDLEDGDAVVVPR